MTGRHSLEKAKRIKEKRELAQELGKYTSFIVPNERITIGNADENWVEDVKSFEKSVMRKGRKTKSSEGEDEDSESEDDGKPAKRKVGIVHLIRFLPLTSYIIAA